MAEEKPSGETPNDWTPGFVMSPDFWINSWAKGDAKEFHLPKISELLTKYKDTLIAGRKQVKILLPFCGKDVSMKYLADAGHLIVGIECAKQACEEFFKESKVEYTTETVGKFTLFKSSTGNIKLYCGDLYDYKPEFGGDFGAVWDRGALNATNTSERTKYVDLMLSLMADDCITLLTVFAHEDPKIAEEWECISDERIIELYGPTCDVTLRLEYVEAGKYNEGLGMDDMDGMLEKLTLIKRKK